MLWEAQVDHFVFKININPEDIYLKREVLSEIAKVHNLLGLIDLILTKAKTFMQGLGYFFFLPLARLVECLA